MQLQYQHISCSATDSKLKIQMTILHIKINDPMQMNIFIADLENQVRKLLHSKW